MRHHWRGHLSAGNCAGKRDFRRATDWRKSGGGLCAPRELPATILIRNAHRVRDWEMFLKD
jgi:hypothetical protein